MLTNTLRVLWIWAHTTYKGRDPRVMGYHSHLVLLHVNPFRVVYISENIVLHQDVYRDQQPPCYVRFLKDFYFPTSLLVESADSLLIGAHVNDYSSHLLRIHGIQNVMRDVMGRDRKLGETPVIEKHTIESLIKAPLHEEFYPLEQKFMMWNE